MELFLDNPPMKKEASASHKLSDNVAEWSHEIMTEAYRQLPFLGEFNARLIIRKQDDDKRYAVGAVEVTNKTAANPRDERHVELSKCHLPFVVKGGKLYPLDVCTHNGRMWPANKVRIRRAMFRPQIFEPARRGADDQSLASIMLPPDRDGPYRGYVKEAAPRKLLERIVGTANMTDYAMLVGEVSKMASELLGNEAVVDALEVLAENPPTRSGDSFVKQAFQAVPPSVIQVSKIEGGFRIKTANPRALSPDSSDVDRPTAIEAVGQDVVRRVEDGGTITVSTNAAVKDVMYEAAIKAVQEFGQYKVRAKDGRELVGWVFPRVMSLTGTQLPLAVFSNGSESAIQAEIAGTLVSKSTNLIDVTPEGAGVFYLARQGSAVALEPLTVKHEVVGPDGVRQFQVTVGGKTVVLVLTADIKSVAPLGGNRFAIPDDVGFMPLNKTTKLVETPEAYVTGDATRELPKTAEILHDSGHFTLRGMGVTKLAQALPVQYVDHDQAMFDLVLVGHAPHEARQKLATAVKRGSVHVHAQDITTTAELYEQAKVAAAKVLKTLPSKPRLLKLAAELPDPVSVDHVLALGFINPENVETFIDSIPDLEDTLSRMCELLISARIGLRVDSTPLERGIKNVETVIQELRAITQQPQKA